MIDDKEQWNKFVAGQSHAQFLQSWEWGEFQKAFGRRVWRIMCHSEQSEESSAGGAQIGVAQFFEHYLGLGMGYLYCPRGPVFSLSFRAERGISELFEFIKKDIVNYGHVFFRFEPSIPCHSSESGNPDARRIHSIQPTRTLLLDLNKSEEQLLAEMHQKTRYNVRLAEKKELEFSDNKMRFDIFWQLMLATARRDKIKLHSKKYYKLMLQISNCHLLVANFQNKMLAGGIFMGFGDSFTYVHGASANDHRDLMAPYFLHWRAIQFAKSQGYRYYDFGGINPDDEKDFDFKASWAGITRFKRGFGGGIFSFVGAYEIPFQPKVYKLFQQIKKIRKFI